MNDDHWQNKVEDVVRLVLEDIEQGSIVAHIVGILLYNHGQSTFPETAKPKNKIKCSYPFLRPLSFNF